MMKSISFGVQICFQENQFSKKKKERKKINYRAIWQITINYRANYLAKDQCHEEKKRVKNLRIGNNNYRIDLYVTS